MNKHFWSSIAAFIVLGLVAYFVYLFTIDLVMDDVRLHAFLAIVFGVSGMIVVAALLSAEHAMEMSPLKKELERATDMSCVVNRTKDGGIVFKGGNFKVVCTSGSKGIVMKVKLLGGQTIVYDQGDEDEIEPSGRGKQPES